MPISASLGGINILAYFLFIFFSWLAKNTEIPLIGYSESLLTLAVIFVLGGFNFAALVQVLLRKKFGLLEFLNISAAFALIAIPLVNYTETLFLNKHSGTLVVINSLIIYLITLLIAKFLFVGGDIKLYNPHFTLEWSGNSFFRFCLSAVVFYAILLFAIIAAYNALPDLDPYYWMSRNQTCVALNGARSCINERPLFETLNLLFTFSAKVDIYAYFKYVLPLLSMVVVLPAMLLAKTARTLPGKIIFVLLPLSVPSTLLYLLTPMPQMIAIILAYYFFYWLAYSATVRNSDFYYLAGIISFFIFWYHEVGIVFFLGWFIVTAIKKFRTISGYFRNQRTVAVLSLLLILSNIAYLKKPYDFAAYWIANFFGAFGLKFNLAFPASYVNIDGNIMGWYGMTGVIKYYLFYAGPVLFAVFFIGAYYLYQHKKRGLNSLKPRYLPDEFLILSFIFSFFIILAEVLPRLFSYAFLPERLWIFAGITAFYLLVYFRNEWESKQKISVGLLLLVLTGTGGAVYINQQKHYALPDYRLNAAEWMRDNLPSDQIVLTTGDKNLMRFHAQSHYYVMPPDFYCNQNLKSAKDIWSIFEKGNVPYAPKLENIESAFRKDLAEYIKKGEVPTVTALQAIVSKYASMMSYGDKRLGEEDLKSSGYIYYYKEDPRNPYYSRPYYKKNTVCESSAFEGKPEQFKLLYDENGMVKIWKIIK